MAIPCRRGLQEVSKYSNWQAQKESAWKQALKSEMSDKFERQWDRPEIMQFVTRHLLCSSDVDVSWVDFG